MKYGCYRNGIIKIEPIEFLDLCQNWIDPDTGQTIGGLENATPEYLEGLGVYPSQEETPAYNKYCEQVVEGVWEFDETSHTFLKIYEKEYLDFSTALKNCAVELDKNREKYEVGGFQYTWNEMTVVILTDKESSQPKINASYTKAKEGTRLDTDVWKFNLLDGNMIIVQLSNVDLIDIADFVFRTIQDSYNLTSQLFWQMLGCGDTQTLKTNIENNTINLNPWGV